MFGLTCFMIIHTKGTPFISWLRVKGINQAKRHDSGIRLQLNGHHSNAAKKVRLVQHQKLLGDIPTSTVLVECFEF